MRHSAAAARASHTFFEYLDQSITLSISGLCLSTITPQWTITPSDKPKINSTLNITCSATGDIVMLAIQKVSVESNED